MSDRLNEKISYNHKVYDANYWKSYAVAANKDHTDRIAQVINADEGITETRLILKFRIQEGAIFTGHHFDNSVYQTENDMEAALLSELDQNDPVLAENIRTALTENNVLEMISDKNPLRIAMMDNLSDEEVIGMMDSERSHSLEESNRAEKAEALRKAVERGEKIWEHPLFVVIRVPECSENPDWDYVEAIKAARRSMKHNAVAQLSRMRPDLIEANERFRNNMDMILAMWNNNSKTDLFDLELAKKLYAECKEISQKFKIDAYLDIEFLTYRFQRHGMAIDD